MYLHMQHTNSMNVQMHTAVTQMHICINCKSFRICIYWYLHLIFIRLWQWKCKCKCKGKSACSVYMPDFSLTDVPNQYPQVPVQVFIDGQIAISSPLKGGEHVPLEAQAFQRSEQRP